MIASSSLCYVCLTRTGTVGICACKRMPICASCQARALQEVPSYEGRRCPVCRVAYTNLGSRECCSVPVGLVVLIVGVPFSPIILGLLYAIGGATTVGWYVLVSALVVCTASAVASVARSRGCDAKVIGELLVFQWSPMPML